MRPFGHALYVVGTADLNRKLSVKVTGRLAGYTTVSKISIPTLKVTLTHKECEPGG